jgi:hypothetical protein
MRCDPHVPLRGYGLVIFFTAVWLMMAFIR